MWLESFPINKVNLAQIFTQFQRYHIAFFLWCTFWRALYVYPVIQLRRLFLMQCSSKLRATFRPGRRNKQKQMVLTKCRDVRRLRYKEVVNVYI